MAVEEGNSIDANANFASFLNAIPDWNTSWQHYAVLQPPNTPQPHGQALANDCFELKFLLLKDQGGDEIHHTIVVCLAFFRFQPTLDLRRITLSKRDLSRVPVKAGSCVYDR
ncbi:hypothetical protein O6H91_01G014800 [Diphasiastrum complanatum]|uniref:Uncharacterized protein n=1 Tax=Diphasiastrum complanatum TaxID=34168 RepID=A0ACC2ENK7_DIPCM|nr:hypothetical protein O6H91_01G014800 [Diphasiastrum complanatum]